MSVKRITFALALCCLSALAVLAGCASIFGRSTDDPAVKLKWASEDFSSKDAPVEAEKLIREAIELFEKKKDELGLAEAYRQYGLFYRSNAVSKAKAHYLAEGFLDKSVTFKNRYEKAIEYFNRSKDLFADFGHYDVLSNLYISLAKTYDITNRKDEACDAFYRSIESFARFKMAAQDPGEQRSDEIVRYREYVDLMKEQAGCPDAPSPSAVPSRPAGPVRTEPLSPFAPSAPMQPEQPAQSTP